MPNTESTKAFYNQTQKQSCTLHPAGDHTHLPLSYPASITELFLIHGFQKVAAPCFHELGPHKSRKNNYLENHAMYTNGTCTTMLLTTCTFQ